MLRVNHLIGFSVGAVGAPGGGPGGAIGFYAFVNKTGDQSIAGGSGNVALTWEAEVSDVQGIHDNSTANTQFIIPAAWNGRYGRVAFNIRHNGGEAGFTAQTWKGGASYPGAARPDVQTGSDDYCPAYSAPVVLATGNYFEIAADDDTNTVAGNNTWAMFEMMPSTFSGALITKTVDQSLSAATFTDLVWATEVYDVGGWFAVGTSASELTVPSGPTLVRLQANIFGSSVAGQLVGLMLKNNANFRGMAHVDCDTDGLDSVNLMSAPIAVTAGDDFKAQAFFTNAADVIADDRCWFSIHALPSSLKYALVHRTTQQNLTISTPAIINWTSEVADTDAWHDNSTNPSRLTVPSGVSKVRVGFNIQTVSATGPLTVRILKNGSSFLGMAQVETDTAGTDNVNGWSAILDVTPGDYFECEVTQGGVSSGVGSVEQNWFAIEEVPDATS
jgi:hypothetical protein